MRSIARKHIEPPVTNDQTILRIPGRGKNKLPKNNTTSPTTNMKTFPTDSSFMDIREP